jgi:6-pyruvoyltetrahydropterin/6-carboxytetrahydropterin synthase
MKVELRKSFRFEAAHRLPFAPEGHRCRQIHGHSYAVEVCVEGAVDPARQWLVDYGDILAACMPVKERLDHHLLNDVPGLEAGTAEALSVFIWNAIRDRLPGLKEVTVRETETSSCTYRGESAA